MEFLIGALVGGVMTTLLLPEGISRSVRSLASRSIISARKDGAQ